MKAVLIKLSFAGVLCLQVSCQQAVVERPLPVRAPAPIVAKGVLEGQYVGLSLAKAKALARQQNRRFRVKMLDGQHQMLTKDYRRNRVNATVVLGVVTAISLG